MDQVWQFIAANWATALAGAGLGLAVGTLTGLFGAGGGFIITPALNIFLGLPMNIAVGTSATQVLGASSFALWRQMDRRFLGIRVAAVMGLGIPGGAYLGTGVVERAKAIGEITVLGSTVAAADFILLTIFVVFLSLLAAWLFLDNFVLRRGKDEDETQHRGFLAWVRIPPLVPLRTVPVGHFSAPILVALGLFMGFLSGLLGIGGGVIMMPMLFYLVGQQTKYATQTDLIVVFVAGLSSAINHAIAGNVNYALAGALIFGAFFGTRIGTSIRSRVTGKAIRQYFAFVVLFAVGLVTYKLIAMLH